MDTKTDRSIALALHWARNNAGEHADTIIEALAAYDPERAGARTVSRAAKAPERRPITDEMARKAESARCAWLTTVGDVGEFNPRRYDNAMRAALETVYPHGVPNAPDSATTAETFATLTPDLNPSTAALVWNFAVALAAKLRAAELKYGYSDGWRAKDWMDECRAKLVEHVAKGDPRNFAAYCAFLWHHGERTALPAPDAAAGDPVAWQYRFIGGPEGPSIWTAAHKRDLPALRRNAGIELRGLYLHPQPTSAPTLCEVTDKDSRSASFERIARPLIQWLCKNMHPHCSVIVTPTGAELRDGPDHGLHEGLTMNLHNEMLNLLQRIGLRFESGNATPFARAHITHEEWNALLALFSQPMNLCDGPAAARYDFDGFGWQYIDNGSGSGWASRIEGAELLYTRLKPEPVVGKSVPVTLISTIDDGDDA